MLLLLLFLRVPAALAAWRPAGGLGAELRRYLAPERSVPTPPPPGPGRCLGWGAAAGSATLFPPSRRAPQIRAEGDSSPAACCKGVQGRGMPSLKGSLFPLGDVAAQRPPLHAHRPRGARATGAQASGCCAAARRTRPPARPGVPYLPSDRRVVAFAAMGSGGVGRQRKVLRRGLHGVGVPASVAGVPRCPRRTKARLLPVPASQSLPYVRASLLPLLMVGLPRHPENIAESF